MILLASRVRTAQPPPPTHAKSAEPEGLFGPGRARWVSMAQALGWGATDRPVPTVCAGGGPGGAAVDPLTVLWEAQHQQLLTAEFAPSELIALVSDPVGSPDYWGERVLRRALLGQAHAVELRLGILTDDQANTVHQLITGNRRALAGLSAIRVRWQHATSPAPQSRPPRTESTAAPRAGPPRTTAPPPPTARLTR